MPSLNCDPLCKGQKFKIYTEADMKTNKVTLFIKITYQNPASQYKIHCIESVDVGNDKRHNPFKITRNNQNSLHDTKPKENSGTRLMSIIAREDTKLL